MSRRGRALAFVLAALLAAVAAAAIADGYGASVARGYGELRPVVVAGEALAAGEPIDPARAVGGAGGAAGAGRGSCRRGRCGRRPRRSGLVPTAAIPAGCLPGRLAAAPAAGRRRRDAGRSGAAGSRSRSRSAAPTRCWSAAARAGGHGRRRRHHRTDRRRRRAAPTSPRRRCRCWLCAPARRRRAEGIAAATLGLTRQPGAAADRRRELRPPGDPAAEGLRMGARERNVAELAATLRARLVERRRAEAAAGRRGRPTCARPCASWSRRGGGAAPAPIARRSRHGSSATASASGRWRICSPIRRSRR